MGLDNIPVHPHGRAKKGKAKPFTHKPDTPCPFRDIDQPLGIFGTCCWLRGKVAARELEALGRTALADRMFEDMTPEEARAFGAELKAEADALEKEHTDPDRRPKGAGWNGVWDKTAKTWVWEDYSTFEEALAAIRTAAAWYEMVARLNLGVHAWY